jgi:hypothetical protein
MKQAPLILITAGLFVFGTSCIMRSTEDYQRDTKSLVETKTSSIKDCLDSARAADPNATGDVVVTFTVAKKTGALENIAADEAKSTAPAPLQACVTEALAGLSLDPGDMGPGEVTATWSLQGG